MTTKNQVDKKQDREVELTEDRPVFIPATDIYEKENSLLLRCDMPGVDDEHLEVVLEDNVLTLTGSQAGTEWKGYSQMLGEYHTGVFHRTFSIPQEIDHDHIKARLQEGVLELELPKAEQARPKRIKVEVN